MIYIPFLKFTVSEDVCQVASMGKNVLVFSTGTQDYKKSLNLDMWEYCYSRKCCKSPKFYPEVFDVAAKNILRQRLHMEKQDIDTDNAKLVYLYLLRKFN